MSLKIINLDTPTLGDRSYIAHDGKTALVVDPQRDIDRVEEMLNSDHEYAPGVDKFTMDSPAPLRADADGKYPIPMPGIKNDREF